MDITYFSHILQSKGLLNSYDRVIVAVSAGPDSVALLSLLAHSNLALEPVAVYIDHGLRPTEVVEEKEIVIQLANSFGIEHEIVAVDVKGYCKEHGTSLEQGGRIQRYKALEELRQTYKAEAIAVAHTADDQAEEVLLRLFRGTGLKGLSGMKMKNKNVIRPLLYCSKKELMTYLEENSLSFSIDSSNEDRRFLRNRLRLDIMPQLKKYFNSNLQPTLLQTADILQKDNDLLEDISERALAECIKIKDGSTILDIDIFLNQHLALQRRIMEKICWQYGSTPTFQHIYKLCQMAQIGKNGAEMHMGQGLRIVKQNQTIQFSQPVGKKRIKGSIGPVSFDPLTIEIGPYYTVSELDRRLRLTRLNYRPDSLEEGELLVDGDNLGEELIFRQATAGERFTPAGMSGRKKITRFLSDIKIPSRQRNHYPVILSDDSIVAVLPLRVDEQYIVHNETKKFILISWQPLNDKE